MAALSGPLLALAPSTADASPTSVVYLKARQVCHTARPHGARCMAERLVRVRKGTPGAEAYAVSGSGNSSSTHRDFKEGKEYTPAELASAYGFNPSAGGSGQTIGIVDAYDDPNIEADLATFDTKYGLPQCTTTNGCFEKVSQTGSTTELPEGEPEWGTEISLDVETAHSVCPNCKIVLVEAKTEEFSDLAAAVNEAVALGATEVSNSYGGPEGRMGATEQAAYNHRGIVIDASAGDYGYDNEDLPFEGDGTEPNAPASLPTVVAVGGTTLEITKSTGARKSETVWRESGGGCSTLFTAPSWQQGIAGWSQTGCASMRLDNDISADANPATGFEVYDSYEAGGWFDVGGTSLSSPLITGLFALAGGSHGVAYPAQTLYEHAGEQNALYDVTEGSNGSCGEKTACEAAVGYDGPSGLGAPKGLLAFGGSPPATKPTAKTGKATKTASSATLNATVNPNGGLVTACTFEYGTTEGALAQSIECSSLPGSGTSPVAVSASITGLSAKTKYYYRIVASEGSDTDAGKVKTFKTPK